MKPTMLVLATMIITSCATVPYKAKSIERVETEWTQGTIGDSTVAVTKKGHQVIMTEETNALDEMRVLQAVNTHIQEEYNHEAYALKSCRRDLSDPRLGGNGQLPGFGEADSFRPPVEIREELGLVDNDELDTKELKIVRTKFFNEQLSAEQRYEKTLRKMLRVTTEAREQCEWRMGQARIKVGLPAQRIMAEGRFTSEGNWVETRKGENSLDDAFEIQADRSHSKKGH